MKLTIDGIYEGRYMLATFYSSLALNSVDSAGVRLPREKAATIKDVYKDRADNTKTIVITSTKTNL